jgi:hypothetical protein
MKNGTLLYVGARADEDGFGITAQGGVKPDATGFGQGNIADNDGAGRKPHARMELMTAERRLEHSYGLLYLSVCFFVR